MQEFIYCFAATADPQVFKFSTSKPLPHTLQFACQVEKAAEKLTILQQIMERYVPSLGDGLYRLSPEEASDFLSLAGSTSGQTIETTPVQTPVVYTWDMKSCFTDGQPIRHRIGTHHTLVGEYRSDRVDYFGRTFLSLREFARYHYRNFSPYWTENDFLNGWYECECKVEGEWQYAYRVADTLVKKSGLVNDQRVRHCVGENIWTGAYDNGCILHSKKKYSDLQHFAISHLYNAKASMDAAQRLEAEVDSEWYPLLLQ